jgi:hypothetical protein
MYPSPAQTIDVVIHTGPAPWWQIVAAVGPIVLILIIELVLIVLLVLRSFRGRHGGFQAGQGSEVDWEHLQWALDSSASNDPQRARMGRLAVDSLSRLRLNKEDRDLLAAASLRRPPSVSSESRRNGEKLI